jgi:heme o synthase
MRSYLDLTKFGITTFVLFTASAGFFLSHPLEGGIVTYRWLIMSVSLYFFSAGIFALNQYQERDIDKKMDRTKNRPLPSGKVKPDQVFFLCMGLIVVGLYFALEIHVTMFLLEVFTLFFYNVVYTKFWKPTMPFAAIPGAIPGAMPVVVGYAVNKPEFWTLECGYLFLIMFLWQMPHFWALAIKYSEDYKKGGIPVLPASRGNDVTIFYTGIYLFAYITLALACPWFAPAWWGYLLLVIPISIKLMWTFFAYFNNQSKSNWTSFFLWVTFSVIFYVGIPVLDRWAIYVSPS